MSRYSNIEYVMGLDVEDGFELIKKAYEQRNEDLLMQRWINGYQSEMGFEDFKAKVTVKQDTRSKEEILGMVNNIITSFNERG